MKFTWTKIIALNLMLATPCSAKIPILITFDREKGQAQLAARLLTQRWHIPSSLIELRHYHPPCKVDRSRVIHLCFKNSGQMVLAKYDEETVNESFRIFFR